MRRPFLIPFPALAATMACAYLFGSPVRTETPSFEVAKSVADMRAWGAVFAVGAVVLTVALLLHDKHVTAIGLWVGGTIYTWWGSCFGVAALTDPHASLTAWAIHGSIGLAHYYAAWKIWTTL